MKAPNCPRRPLRCFYSLQQRWRPARLQEVCGQRNASLFSFSLPADSLPRKWNCTLTVCGLQHDLAAADLCYCYLILFWKSFHKTPRLATNRVLTTLKLFPSMTAHRHNPPEEVFDCTNIFNEEENNTVSLLRQIFFHHVRLFYPAWGSKVNSYVPPCLMLKHRQDCQIFACVSNWFQLWRGVETWKFIVDTLMFLYV